MPRKAALADPAKRIKEIQHKLSRNIDQDLDTVNDFLMSVVKGVDQDGNVLKQEQVGKNGVEEIVVPHQTRVMAARTWKEINLDKLVPDSKSQPAKATDVKDKSGLEDSVKRVAAKRAEERAKKEGKLTKLKGGRHG